MFCQSQLAKLSIVLIVLLVACTASTPTSLPLPSPAPLPPVIAPENAARLQQAGQISVSYPDRLIWSLDSRSLGVRSQTDLYLCDAATLKSTRVFTITAPTKLLGLSPDGRTLASTVDNKVVELRDATTGQVVRTLQPSGQFLDAAFSPDGRTLALTSADEIAVTLWDVTTGQSQRTLSGFQTAAPVYSVIFSPDGRTLIWIARAKVQLMDINSGQLGNAFEHEDFVSDTALTPDGRILATASAGTVNNKYVPFVKLWDAASGRGLGTLIHGDEYTTSIAFSPDGRILAAGSGKSVILWDVATQEELITLSGHTDRVSSVAFSPDGRTLASAGSDGTVRLWQVGR